MKALSVRAPWAWAILHGKPVENREWSTNVRGRILLHQSKFWKEDEIGYDLDDIYDMAASDKIKLPEVDMEAMKASRGCLVGSVVVVDCVTAHPSAFFQGKFGFVLDDPVPFARPIPYKGMLGFFEVNESTLWGR
jgi:hypothetical protein